MSKADPVIVWMLDEGRTTRHEMPAYVGSWCAQILAAGIPIVRMFYGVYTLHPVVGAVGYVWRHGNDAAERILASWDDTQSPGFRHHPMVAVGETGIAYRKRLSGTEGPLEYPILEQMRDEGITDYISLPMTFSDGAFNPISFQTDAPDGFSDTDLEALERLAAAMSLVVEAEMRYRVALGLLDTYVGERTGRRVLSGAIRRGMGETIPAVVWFSDLRGFTALTGTLGHDRLLAHLDAYFGAVGEAVKDNGGEILKFLGDGVLAIFEVSETDDAATRCRAALCAADAAQSAIDALNRENPEVTRIRWGLALDLGEVYYGNVGTPDRLDFTVIGTAVNLASRLEALAAGMGEPIVTSARFAEALGEDMRDLGSHPLKGFAEPQAVFAPKSQVSFWAPETRRSRALP